MKRTTIYTIIKDSNNIYRKPIEIVNQQKSFHNPVWSNPIFLSDRIYEIKEDDFWEWYLDNFKNCSFSTRNKRITV